MMAQLAVPKLFAAISQTDWNAVPSAVAKKIEIIAEEQYEQLMTGKAIAETGRCNAEKSLNELQTQFDQLKTENGQLSFKLEAASSTITELENQLSRTITENNKLQEASNRLEKEMSDYRHQRNMAIDERDELQKMLNRRNSEIERLQADFNTITKQLETAIAAKCEAINKAEEVASLKMTLEYKEKRIEQERSLIMQQFETLTEELHEKTDELLGLRRDNTSRVVQLETKLSEKIEELRLNSETIKAITDANNNLIAKIEDMNKRSLEEKETIAKTQQAFQHEMDAQKKLVDLYLEMAQEKTELTEKLTKGYQEVKTKLDEAIEKYGELETKHKEMLLMHEEVLNKKNECIELLKKELDASQILLETSKNDSFRKEVEDLSPAAAVASKFIKSGMSMTQIYSEYMTVNEQMTNLKEENGKLQAYLTSIVQEIEEKSPYLAKQREDFEKAQEMLSEMSKHNEELMNEVQILKEGTTQAKRLEGATARENARLKKELQDLGRQVCYLLREVEHSRAGSSSTSTDHEMSDTTNSSADIISKRLVTFGDISELQANNQRLITLVRELSSKQEEAEELDMSVVDNLKSRLENTREEHAELLEKQERQAKMMTMLINQRDMYKNLYHQAMKGAGEDPIQIEKQENGSQSPKPQENENGVSDEKVQSLEAEIEKLTKELKTIKEEYEVYKKEKAANEKLMIEDQEKTRANLQEMMVQNTKLSAKIENLDEMFKVLKNNTSIYKNQIEKLEERNKLYSETIVKHETSVTFLRESAMEAQTKLARAEVITNNLQKENALLRDSEERLLKERENMKRSNHSQNLLHTNIELIKATLERKDAESKLHLEEQLREAHRECSALRRRLQEEQDRFRGLTEHLEKQTQTAQNRMEEEKRIAEKLREELADVREDLIGKTNQVEELSKKLKMSLFAGADTSVDSKKYRELEKMLNERQAEIESLTQKLKSAKEAVEQHCNVAEGAEKQLVEIVEANKKYKEAAETKMKEQEKKIKDLEDQCSELQGELSVYNDGQESSATDLKKLERVVRTCSKDLAESKEELEAAKAEIKNLQEGLQQAESKYAHEILLHSNDLQILSNLKEELAKTADELEELRIARDKAIGSLEESKECWSKEEELYKKEKGELENRFKDMDVQNSLLLNQLQEMNTQLAIVQTQSSEMNSSNAEIDVSFNRSLTEDDVKSSDQLLKIIRYLRQEKDIAISKCEILEAEHMRMKSLHEAVTKQLEEAKSALDSERENSDVSCVTAAKHAEVLRKVETLNAITDSNRSLRMERDTLLSQFNELKARTGTLEEQLSPLQEKNRELSIKAESMQTENLTLRGEATRWRQRANMLIEKSNRTSPEDWKKLQNERESLAKQLMIERSNNTQLNADFNNLTKDKLRLEEQLKEVRSQLAAQKEDIDRMNEELVSLRAQVGNLGNDLQTSRNEHIKLSEEHRTLLQEVTNKDAMITDLKNNLMQIRKIAKKYKTQWEDVTKELEESKKQLAAQESMDVPAEKQEQFRQEGRVELEQRLSELESSHQLRLEEMSQQISSSSEENESFKKEIENLKQTSLEKEERFKTLFKNAKDRIMTLTEQNTSLKVELTNQGLGKTGDSGQSSGDKEKSEEIDKLKKEKEEILAEKQAEKERLTQEIENLTQRVNQLQRQLGLQQGSKPSTSSGSTEKSTTEPPTANIKPMTTQTQSVTIQPWRSGGEPPLASIRPMSMPLRTVAVCRTGQSPSVMVPPQQQVHTTGSSSIEALSSSPTSSHTDYAPATSSASSAMIGVRQVAVPPTQSSQDAEDEDSGMQVQGGAPQQQAVALVLPRVEPLNSGPTQEQGTSSSSSSNTVTTTQAGHKRPRETDTDSCQSDDSGKQQQQAKRTRIQGTTTTSTETFQSSVSESGLEVEYQVPTSSQRDHEEDTENVIVVESDEEGDGPDEGEGADDDPDDADNYDMDPNYAEQMNYEDGECQDVEEDEGGNEVEVIEDSSEVPNQSERPEGTSPEEGTEQAQSEAISSGTDGTSHGITVSQASTSVSITMPNSRTRPVAPLSRQQQPHLLLPEDGGDGIVPSTPTLFGFGEAVSSPHVPTSGRFTFNDSVPPSNVSNEVIPEQTLEMPIDDNGTGRSVPSTPLQASPQEAGPSGEEQSGHQGHNDGGFAGEIPSITVSGVGDEVEQAPEGSSGECMGPPSVAGTSSETMQQDDQQEEMLEGEDGVTSEGEKTLAAEEGEEEGREAEASPSTNTRSKTTPRGSPGPSRRSIRQSPMMRGAINRPSPTPIVWGVDQRAMPRQDMSQRGGRGQQGGNFPPRLARRSRGRIQRPYGGGGSRF